MDALYLGAVLPAAVKGVEDHGYSLTFGVKVRRLCPERQVISTACGCRLRKLPHPLVAGTFTLASRNGERCDLTGQARCTSFM